eukprot:UN31566
MGGGYQSEWHFVNTPYLDNDPDISHYDFKFDPKNITLIVPQLIDYLVDKGDVDNYYAVQEIRAHAYKGATENDNKSTALRLLIHYIGDLHQPLHAATRVDDAYPSGDRGGNSFP